MMWLRFFIAAKAWTHTPNARLVGAGLVVLLVLAIAAAAGSFGP